jgi:hypothetical protein
MNNASPAQRFTDILIAVYGIGQQSRYSTIRSVAANLVASEKLMRDVKERPVAQQPLGYFIVTSGASLRFASWTTRKD